MRPFLLASNLNHAPHAVPAPDDPCTKITRCNAITCFLDLPAYLEGIDLTRCWLGCLAVGGRVSGPLPSRTAVDEATMIQGSHLPSQ